VRFQASYLPLTEAVGWVDVQWRGRLLEVIGLRHGPIQPCSKGMGLDPGTLGAVSPRGLGVEALLQWSPRTSMTTGVCTAADLRFLEQF